MNTIFMEKVLDRKTSWMPVVLRARPVPGANHQKRPRVTQRENPRRHMRSQGLLVRDPNFCRIEFTQGLKKGFLSNDTTLCLDQRFRTVIVRFHRIPFSSVCEPLLHLPSVHVCVAAHQDLVCFALLPIVRVPQETVHGNSQVLQGFAARLTGASSGFHIG